MANLIGLLSRAASRGAGPLATLGAVAAPSLIEDAYAQDAPSGGDDTRRKIRSLETELELFRNPQSEDDVKTIQRRLRGASLYDGPIDGVWAGGTQAAAKQYVPAVESNLESLRTALARSEAEGAYLRNRPSDAAQLLREIAPWVATGAGLAAGHATRHSAVKKAADRLLARNARVNAFLADTPLPAAPLAPRTATGKPSRSARALAQHQADLEAYQSATRGEVARRAGDLNDFWREGGAGSRVPFQTVNTPAGIRAAPQNKVADLAELYPAGKELWRGNDVGMLALGATEAVGSGTGYVIALGNLKKAEEEVKRNPSDASYKKLREAENWVKVLESAMRLGVAFTASRAYGPFLDRYRNIRPNTALANSGRAWINQFLSQK